MITRIEIKPSADLVEVTAMGQSDQKYVRGMDRFMWRVYFDNDLIQSGECNTLKGAENAAKLVITVELALFEQYHGGTIIEGWLPGDN